MKVNIGIAALIAFAAYKIGQKNGGTTRAQNPGTPPSLNPNLTAPAVKPAKMTTAVNGAACWPNCAERYYSEDLVA